MKRAKLDNFLPRNLVQKIVFFFFLVNVHIYKTHFQEMIIFYIENVIFVVDFYLTFI